MKISPYGLMVLTILVISSPALVLAEAENEVNEGLQALGKTTHNHIDIT